MSINEFETLKGSRTTLRNNKVKNIMKEISPLENRNFKNFIEKND